MTKEVVSISLGPSSHDYELSTRMFHEEIHVRRFGTDGDVSRASELVAHFDGLVDAIGLGGMNIYFRVGRRTYVHQQIQRVASAAKTTPVVDGWDAFDASPRELEALRRDLYGTQHKPISEGRLPSQVCSVGEK